MGRKAAAVVPSKYDVHTEDCPRMTRRWRREVIPEILAWLTVHAVRTERQKLHVDQACQAGGGEGLRDAGKRLAVRLDILADLARQVGDKWDEGLWWACAKRVDPLCATLPVKPVHTPSIPGTESPEDGAPPVIHAATGTSDAGPDRPAGDRGDQRGGKRVRPPRAPR